MRSIPSSARTAHRQYVDPSNVLTEVERRTTLMFESGERNPLRNCDKEHSA